LISELAALTGCSMRWRRSAPRSDRPRDPAHRARARLHDAAQSLRRRRRMKSRRVPLLATIAVVATILASVPTKPLVLVWNASPSVPLGLYRVTSDTAPRAGDLIIVRPSPPLARFMADRRYVESGVPL